MEYNGHVFVAKEFGVTNILARTNNTIRVALLFFSTNQTCAHALQNFCLVQKFGKVQNGKIQTNPHISVSSIFSY